MTPRGVARKLEVVLDEVRGATLDYGDGFGAYEALADLPPLIRRERDPYRRIALRTRLAHCAYMVTEYEIAMHESRVALRAIAKLTDRPNAPEAWLRQTLGTCLSRRGDGTAAVHELRRAADLYAAVGDGESQAETLAELAEALIGLGDDDVARPILEECLTVLRGSWARDAGAQLARIAQNRGDLDAEIAALETVRRGGLEGYTEFYDELDALTSSTEKLADALLRRGNPKDRERAIELLDESLQRIRSYGVGRTEGDTDGLRRRLRTLRKDKQGRPHA